MFRTRIAINHFRCIYIASLSSCIVTPTRTQFQCPHFHFHPHHYSSSAPKQDFLGADDHYPTGDFDFKPVTGWKKFTTKLKMLTMLPWKRLPYGTVFEITLRGQVITSNFSPTLTVTIVHYFTRLRVCLFRYLISSRVGSVGDYHCLNYVIIS